MEEEQSFRPNAIQANDIDQLNGWKLLVAAVHHAEMMTDCVDGDYEYRFEDGSIVLVNPDGTVLSLQEDVDMSNPEKAIQHFVLKGLPPWEWVARASLRERISGGKP